MPEIFQTVPVGMQDEEHARRCRMRLYGFHYERSRAIAFGPGILVHNFFRFGLSLDDNFISSHSPEVQWVVANNVAKSYILLTFPSARKCKEVRERRKTADINYRPHSRPITMCRDLSPEEDSCLEEAERTFGRLGSKNVDVFRRGLEIRIGNPPNAKWYKYNSPEILELLEKPATSSKTTPV